MFRKQLLFVANISRKQIAIVRCQCVFSAVLFKTVGEISVNWKK